MLKTRQQALFQIGEEDFAVHRGIDNEWSGDAVLAQTGDVELCGNAGLGC
jgi:hypothetical protein